MDIDKVFIGYIAVTEAKKFISNPNVLLSGYRYEVRPLKKACFYKKSSTRYIDLETNEEYEKFIDDVGSIFILDEYLKPLTTLLYEENETQKLSKKIIDTYRKIK